jgi:rubrerythrin
MNNRELARAVRQDIIAELDAIALYEAHIDATDDEAAKRVIKHVMDEEKDHVGDFMALLEYLDPDMASLMKEGFDESSGLLQGARPEELEEAGEMPEPSAPPAPHGLTVGSLIGT